MNNEIKEIYLSNLEWTKTHDNMGGVMGNLIFKDNIPYEEYEKLLKSGYFILCNKDYITNLQQEIEKLNEDKRGMLVQLYKANDDRDKVKQENERKDRLIDEYKEGIIAYADRNEKAIEYFKYQLENLDFYEDTKARMLCAMGITLLQNRDDSQ
jgi:FtsZ-binding cell division protein ZapB